jgi:hypothetical protein
VFQTKSILFPKFYRNAGYGYASVFARVGGVLAPFSNTFVSVDIETQGFALCIYYGFCRY